MTAPTNTFDIGNEKRRQVTGAWIVYFTSAVIDGGPITESIHPEELDARRAAMDMPIPARVVFVPWDTTILNAIEQDRLTGTRKVVVLDTPLDIPEEPLPEKSRPTKAAKTGTEANE